MKCTHLWRTHTRHSVLLKPALLKHKGSGMSLPAWYTTVLGLAPSLARLSVDGYRGRPGKQLWNLQLYADGLMLVLSQFTYWSSACRDCIAAIGLVLYCRNGFACCNSHSLHLHKICLLRLYTEDSNVTQPDGGQFSFQIPNIVKSILTLSGYTVLCIFKKLSKS